MHQLIGVCDCRPERLSDRLVSEAHPEEWLTGDECGVDDGDRHARGRGRSRARRKQHGVVVGDHRRGVDGREGVVAEHRRLSAQLQEIAVEGVNEAVVVVDDEYAGHSPTVTSVTLTKVLTQGKTT